MVRMPASATFGAAALQHEVLALHPAEIPRPLLEGLDKGPRGVIATLRLDTLELHTQRPRCRLNAVRHLLVNWIGRIGQGNPVGDRG
jgi:hypothetical protein